MLCTIPPDSFNGPMRSIPVNWKQILKEESASTDKSLMRPKHTITLINRVWNMMFAKAEN